MATGTITDKINHVVALLVDQCKCGTPSEIKAAFHELQAALNAQLTAVTAIIATLCVASRQARAAWRFHESRPAFCAQPGDGGRRANRNSKRH
jgi:hypothetical protein